MPNKDKVETDTEHSEELEALVLLGSKTLYSPAHELRVAPNTRLGKAFSRLQEYGAISSRDHREDKLVRFTQTGSSIYLKIEDIYSTYAESLVASKE